VERTSRSTAGWAAVKRPSRGTSQRTANDGCTLTTSRTEPAGAGAGKARSRVPSAWRTWDSRATASRVGTIRRFARRNRGVCSLSSSSRMRWLTAPWVTPSSAAATE
jgi:hypothetical protein